MFLCQIIWIDMVFKLNLLINRGVFKVLPTHPYHKLFEVTPLGPYQVCVIIHYVVTFWKIAWWLLKTSFQCIRHVLSWESLDSYNYIDDCIEFTWFNQLGKRYQMQDLALFHNKFNKFKNTGAQMLDSIYHMTSEFW